MGRRHLLRCSGDTAPCGWWHDQGLHKIGCSLQGLLTALIPLPSYSSHAADWGAEKPNPVLFQAAFQALGLPPDRCLHVGDDRRNDVHGARDSGCFALLWGQDVASFSEVERRIATGNLYDSLDDA